jgi:DNA-binding transcriptional regulator GbsR (MarR family)
MRRNFIGGGLWSRRRLLECTSRAESATKRGNTAKFLDVVSFQWILKIMNDEAVRLGKAREQFVGQWGAMGSQWGINRTMAQIHALLITAPEPMCTDEVMAELEISRGNAHTNLKELVAWGLLKSVVKKGERREYFEAEKDVWQIFTTVAKERKRREIEPALSVLNHCAEESRDMESPEGRAFHEQMRQLEEFVGFASKVADRVSHMKHGFAVQLAAKLLG